MADNYDSSSDSDSGYEGYRPNYTLAALMQHWIEVQERREARREVLRLADLALLESISDAKMR